MKDVLLLTAEYIFLTVKLAFSTCYYCHHIKLVGPCRII